MKASELKPGDIFTIPAHIICAKFEVVDLKNLFGKEVDDLANRIALDGKILVKPVYCNFVCVMNLNETVKLERLI
jgi:hypothetical protein